MTEEKQKDAAQQNAQNNETDSVWEGFKDYVRKIAAVPKEELDEKLAEERREKKERKRAG